MIKKIIFQLEVFFKLSFSFRKKELKAVPENYYLRVTMIIVHAFFRMIYECFAILIEPLRKALRLFRGRLLSTD